MRYSEDQFAPCLLSTAGVDFKVGVFARLIVIIVERGAAPGGLGGWGCVD